MASWGVVAYLRVENPASSSLGARRALRLRPTSPPRHPQSPPRRALARSRTTSLLDYLATGAPAPALGAGSSAASAALGEGCAGSHLSGRARPPSLSSSSSSPDDEYSEVAREESPCCSRSRNSSLFCSRRSRCQILFSFLRAARSCSRRCAACAHSGSRRGRIGLCCVHGHHL
jgi:hypothetical protein